MLELVFLLAAVCLGLIGFSVWLLLGQRRQAAELAEQAKRHAAMEQRLKELAKRGEAYQRVNVRMGEELGELRKQLASLPERLARLEQRDPTSLSFTQAARLAGMGASAGELAQACGLSQAEAELITRLHRGDKPLD
ncbi:DUF2802 domain-containing protein [Pseudomonas citronellolis]|uniref:DUF2802 domain-containing protein n=1 Tax=Pseudomonas citronellolis TaxID=53408 RepID=UPI0023E44186|nr:DUF2802 domain-containing protein [Pseudomonas citronellolis]MDF3936782.1 DUF2802 domain-containing protein [Pseudomonas citronellolis]